MDLNAQLEEIKKKIKVSPLNGEVGEIQLYMEYLHLLAQLAEEHLQDHYKEWENALYAKEYLHYAPALLAYTTETEDLYGLGKRLADAFSEHPRLKVIFLNWLKSLRSRSNAQPSTTATDDIQQEINLLTQNIRWADSGKLDQIGKNDFFKTDPVEWTEKWENCIDEVYQKVEKLMGEDNYEGGSSSHYWALKTKILKEYGIDWKSPAAMNPDFIFD